MRSTDTGCLDDDLARDQKSRTSCDRQAGPVPRRTHCLYATRAVSSVGNRIRQQAPPVLEDSRVPPTGVVGERLGDVNEFLLGRLHWLLCIEKECRIELRQLRRHRILCAKQCE